jgi:hypothetical protein
MRSAEKFYREVHGAAAKALLKLQEGTALTASDVVYLSHAVEAVKEFACGLSERTKQAKARAERIQWVYCGDRTMVAKYKGSTYRYSGVHRQVDADTKSGWVCLFPATSIESANRKIRAWRKKQ